MSYRAIAEEWPHGADWEDDEAARLALHNATCDGCGLALTAPYRLIWHLPDDGKGWKHDPQRGHLCPDCRTEN